jgi:hypothetical protein
MVLYNVTMIENLNKNSLDFLIFVIELAADNFFGGKKKVAYLSLLNNGILDFYAKTYDTSHTLSESYLLNELSEKIGKKIS